jgi:hypothetical protein
MRCVDVIRELSTPQGPSRDPAVADHLARCARCAEWAARDSRLGRLWELTRPAEPSPDEWESVWGRIADALDRETAPVLPLARPARSRRRLWVCVGVAQVAAAILAVVYFGRFTAQPGPAEAPRGVPVAQAETRPEPPEQPVDIPPGELVMIREEKGRVELVELALNGNPGQVDPAYEALNSLEAIAE